MPRTFSSPVEKEEWEAGAFQKLVELEGIATERYEFYRLPTLVGIRVATTKNLSPIALRLWLYLCSMFPFGDVEQYMPSQAELAARFGVSRRSILRAAAELEEFDLWEFKVERWKGRNMTGHNAPTSTFTNTTTPDTGKKSADKNVTRGDKDFTRGDKNVTPGDKNVTGCDKKEHLPIYKDHARDQTSSDSDQTFEQTCSDLPPNPLKKGEGENEPIWVEVEIVNADQETKTTVTEPDEKSPNSLTVLNTTNPEGNNSSAACDNMVVGERKSKKRRPTDPLTDEELDHWVNAWNAERPSTFVQHKREVFRNDTYTRIINKLINEFGDQSITKLTAALTYCREESSDYWRKGGDHRPTLKNLTTNGKILDLSEKHFAAMENDPAYRDRVEGRAISKDKGRKDCVILNDRGEEMTGVSAEIAQAVVEDEFLQMLLAAKE